LIQVLVAVGVLGWVGWEALREPVQLAHVEKAAHAPMTESFSEEGKTRLKARYALAAPVAGQLRRVTLQPGDAVQAGQVVAWIDPTSPGLLDERSHRRAEAELAAARSQHRAARQRVQAAQAANGLARSSLQRAIRLHEGRVMSQEALEQNKSKLRGSYTWAASSSDTSNYDANVELSWIMVGAQGGTDGPYHIMLFHYGEYLGTGTYDPLYGKPNISRTAANQILATHNTNKASFTWDNSQGKIVMSGHLPTVNG